MNHVIDIMRKYDLPDDCDIPILMFLKACKAENVKINEKIWDKKLLMFCNLPTASKELAIINLAYHRQCPNKKLAEVSDQQSKPIQRLRELGFIFKESLASNGPRYTQNGTRMIVGFKAKKLYSSLKKCSKFNDFKNSHHDPITSQKHSLELDHRTPNIACNKLKIAPKQLTNELIETGQADDYFQFLSRSTNCIKREACKKCIVGQTIPLPDVICKEIYKQHWDEMCEKTKSCIGCFHHNYKKPQFPEKHKATWTISDQKKN